MLRVDLVVEEGDYGLRRNLTSRGIHPYSSELITVTLAVANFIQQR
jgi:hypothetical protein